MSRIGKLLSALAVAAVVSAAWLWWSAGAAPERAPRHHVVEIRGFQFVPPALEVAVGDTIVWVNRDFVPHTATAANGGWDSSEIARDGTWSYVVRERGRHEYFCALHPTMAASFTAE
ncbi:MAG: cupredoxin family copper-binding protein [Gemmatimonadota bacterium]